MRADLGIPDDDDDDYDDESWVNRADHDGLHRFMIWDWTKTELLFKRPVALENAIPSRVVRSYINWMDGLDFRVTMHFVISSTMDPTLGLGRTAHFRLTCFRDEIRGALLKL
jgi:hypothetical protein